MDASRPERDEAAADDLGGAVGSQRRRADDGKVIAELDETDNCLAGNTVEVTMPGLAITGNSLPPAAVQRGHSFSITDTAHNFGSGDILLAGSRSVGALQPSADSTG